MASLKHEGLLAALNVNVKGSKILHYFYSRSMGLNSPAAQTNHALVLKQDGRIGTAGIDRKRDW